MWFWIIASLIILVVGMFLTLALLRGREEGDSTAAYDLQVYRDQLKTADRDLARGVVSAEDAERIKVEISRRILAADKALQAESHGQQAPLGLNVAVLGIGAAVLLGGIGIYLSLGAPGYGDRPLQLRIEQAREIKKNRPSQADAEARMPQNSAKIDPRDQELIEKLREKVAERADDVKAQTLLAGTEAALGNYRAAYEARKRVITLKGNQANARDYAELADAMIMAANGFVSPEAETALKQALNRDPKHGTALYYTGLMFAQNGRPDIAFNIWSELLERSRPNDPWVRPIRSQIKEAAAWAGVQYTLPALESAENQMVGPSAQDMKNAAEMSAEERQQMVQDMVNQLSERLNSEGGSAREWARLISALGVLGETERAAQSWGKAQELFAGQSAELELLRDAARSAGVAK